MIDAKELRIGNIATKWVRTPFGEEFKVRSPYALNIDDIAECSKGTAIFKGVALTEEILIKCGFVYNDNYLEHPMLHLRWITKQFTGADINTPFLRFDSSLKGGSTDIYYLHQLQNLVHALRGEELNVNL